MIVFAKLNKNLEFADDIIDGLDLQIIKTKDKYKYNITKDGITLFAIKVIFRDNYIDFLLITSKNNIDYFKRNDIFNFNALFQMFNLFSNNFIKLSIVQDYGNHYEMLKF